MTWHPEGYDWTELAEHWDIDIHTLSDEAIVEQVQNIIFSNIDERKRIVQDCRIYLKQFIKNAQKCIYSAPLFEGLNKITDDETFLKYFSMLYTHMWI